MGQPKYVTLLVKDGTIGYVERRKDRGSADWAETYLPPEKFRGGKRQIYGNSYSALTDTSSADFVKWLNKKAHELVEWISHRSWSDEVLPARPARTFEELELQSGKPIPSVDQRKNEIFVEQFSLLSNAEFAEWPSNGNESFEEEIGWVSKVEPWWNMKSENKTRKSVVRREVDNKVSKDSDMYVYVVRLLDENTGENWYYVGKTTKPHDRIPQHSTKESSRSDGTLHLKEVVEVDPVDGDGYDEEREKSFNVARRYDTNNVLGGR